LQSAASVEPATQELGTAGVQESGVRMRYAGISLNFMQPMATRSFGAHRLCRTTQRCSSP